MSTKTRTGKPSPMRTFTARVRREFRAKLIEKYGPYCQLCLLDGHDLDVALIDLEVFNEPMSWSIDHIIPMSRGGRNVLENMQPAHKQCNTARGNDDL